MTRSSGGSNDSRFLIVIFSPRLTCKLGFETTITVAANKGNSLVERPGR